MDGNAKISWPQLRMRMTVNASFAHGFRILRYTADKILRKSSEVYEIDSPVTEVWLLNFYLEH